MQIFRPRDHVESIPRVRNPPGSYPEPDSLEGARKRFEKGLERGRGRDPPFGGGALPAPWGCASRPGFVRSHPRPRRQGISFTHPSPAVFPGIPLKIPRRRLRRRPRGASRPAFSQNCSNLLKAPSPDPWNPGTLLPGTLQRPMGCGGGYGSHGRNIYS